MSELESDKSPQDSTPICYSLYPYIMLAFITANKAVKESSAYIMWLSWMRFLWRDGLLETFLAVFLLFFKQSNIFLLYVSNIGDLPQELGSLRQMLGEDRAEFLQREMVMVEKLDHAVLHGLDTAQLESGESVVLFLWSII